MLAAIVLAAAQSASGNVRLEGVAEPFYARVTPLGVPNDGELAAIVFYRPPSCVRADFNLLTFFDVPGAFFCNPPTTETFTIWRKGRESTPRLCTR